MFALSRAVGRHRIVVRGIDHRIDAPFGDFLRGSKVTRLRRRRVDAAPDGVIAPAGDRLRDDIAAVPAVAAQRMANSVKRTSAAGAAVDDTRGQNIRPAVGEPGQGERAGGRAGWRRLKHSDLTVRRFGVGGIERRRTGLDRRGMSEILAAVPRRKLRAVPAQKAGHAAVRRRRQLARAEGDADIGGICRHADPRVFGRRFQYRVDGRQRVVKRPATSNAAELARFLRHVLEVCPAEERNQIVDDEFKHVRADAMRIERCVVERQQGARTRNVWPGSACTAIVKSSFAVKATENRGSA